MREIITLHVGQCGCQIGKECWELFAAEHHINKKGMRTGSAEFGHTSIMSNQDDCDVFFKEVESGQRVPRCIYMDLEPNVIDEISSGPWRRMYNKEFMISGEEDASNNFARGKYTVGDQLFDNQVEKKVLRMVESCGNIQGFLLFSSVGGGTGSGFGSRLLEHLCDKFGKKIPRIAFSVFPSPQISTCIVEPYNSCLSMPSLLDFSEVCVCLDNEAIYNICKQTLKIPKPSYVNLNRLVSQVISSLTASLRFEGELNIDVGEFQTNLVPYPRIHFMLTSYAPLCTNEQMRMEVLSAKNLTIQAFDHKKMMAVCDPRVGKYMSVCLMYRGDVPSNDITAAIEFVKTQRTINFIDWCPTGVKTGICHQPPCVTPESQFATPHRALAMIANTTAIWDIFEKITHKFDMMYAKRAFVHHYVSEGMEESEFSECRENLIMLERDYEQLLTDDLDELAHENPNGQNTKLRIHSPAEI